MNKFKSKKGFTLAELLIVVAIIAVLVAIAVPLFVSGLTKAQKARDDANIHAVKSAAVVQILNTEKNTTTQKAAPGKDVIYTTDGSMYSYFTVTADLDENGNIVASTLSITSTSTDPTAAQESPAKDTIAAKEGGWTVTAYLTSLNLKGISGT